MKPLKTADNITIKEGMNLYLPVSDGTFKGTATPCPKTKKLFNKKGGVHAVFIIMSSWAGDPIKGSSFWNAKKLYFNEQLALDFADERNTNAQRIERTRRLKRKRND